MGVGRQSGHSTSIVRLIADEDLRSVILCPTLKMTEYFKDVFEHRFPDFSYKEGVIFESLNCLNRIRGRAFDSIFVDCSAFCLGRLPTSM